MQIRNIFKSFVSQSNLVFQTPGAWLLNVLSSTVRDTYLPLATLADTTRGIAMATPTRPHKSVYDK